MFNLTLSRLGEGGAESARVGFYKLISPKPVQKFRDFQSGTLL